MRAISIDTSSQGLKEIDIEMQANTVYTFFNSILIDEFQTIKEHTIYTDANALCENKTPFFIGEQLIIGDCLITGGSTLDEDDAKIIRNDLEPLISYEVSKFYKEALAFLSKTDINLYRPFILEKNNEKIKLNTEWVLYTFNIADDKTKKYFLNELSKVLQSTKETQEFIQKMAQLALNAS